MDLIEKLGAAKGRKSLGTEELKLIRELASVCALACLAVDFIVQRGADAEEMRMIRDADNFLKQSHELLEGIMPLGDASRFAEGGRSAMH